MAKVSHLTELRSRPGADEREGEGPDPAEVPSGKMGWVADWTGDGIWVDYLGNPAGPLLAKSLVDWQPSQIQEAMQVRRAVLLVFEQGDERKPVIVGALKPVPKPRPASASAESQSVQVKADGTRVEVSARDEVVLRCGEASITLRRNGRVIIKGAYVETRSRGTNRIKGGHVLIN